MCVLEGFRWLKMCFYIKDRLFLESVAFVYNQISAVNLIVGWCEFAQCTLRQCSVSKL